jgi:hypothetical protein
MDKYEIVGHQRGKCISNSTDLFSSYNWSEVIFRTYNFKLFHFVNKKNNNSIPFTVVNNLKGRQVISLPFCDYIECNITQKDDYISFVEYSKNEYSGSPIVLKTNYSNNIDLGIIIRNSVYHTIDMTKEVIQSAAFLRGVRKAKVCDLVINHENSISGLQKFYQMYAILRINKFNIIPQPFSFFRTIYDIFIANSLGDIITVSQNNKMIAAVIVLFSGNTLYYKFGASDDKNLDVRPNNLIFDYLIKYAKIKGLDNVNLGLSGTSDSYSGLRRFKESMGGLPSAITYFRINSEGYDDSHENNVSGLLNRYTKDIISNNYDIDRINSISKVIYKNFV